MKDYDWKKWITFEQSDPLLEEVQSPDFEGLLSPGEIRDIVKDFKTLKIRFMNLVAMRQGIEDICDDLLDKIAHYSDEDLLAWRKERNDKIEAEYQTIKNLWNATE